MVSPPAAHCGMFPMRVLPLLPSIVFLDTPNVALPIDLYVNLCRISQFHVLLSKPDGFATLLPRSTVTFAASSITRRNSVLNRRRLAKAAHLRFLERCRGQIGQDLYASRLADHARCLISMLCRRARNRRFLFRLLSSRLFSVVDRRWLCSTKRCPVAVRCMNLPPQRCCARCLFSLFSWESTSRCRHAASSAMRLDNLTAATWSYISPRPKWTTPRYALLYPCTSF